MSSPIVTTGVTPSSGVQPTIAPRLDVHEFVNNEKLFSLYVQALQRLYKTSEEKPDSHFQISGIHGLPYERWDNAGPETPQMLNKHAVEVAGTYTTNREEWQKAATDLRLPFWDWARHRLPPKQFYDHRQYSQVTITLPDGSKKPVDNPMLSYKFHTGQGPKPDYPDDEDEYFKALSTVPQTVRHPSQPIGPKTTSNIEAFESALNREYDDTRPNTLTLLLYVKDWFQFSTQRARKGDGASANSLESIHNNLHNRIGDGGHMNYTQYAAFDPIFWLHHCNVDRVLTLWQYINYEKWVTSGAGGYPTWVTQPSDSVNENTELAPFRIDQTNFWTSAQCRAPMNLQYTYEDFQGLDMNNLPAVSEAITRRVEKLYYGPDTFPGFPGLVPTEETTATDGSQGPLGIMAASAPLAGFTESVAAAAATSLTGSTSARHAPESIQWTVRIRCKQADVRHITSILIFIGGMPDSPSNFASDPRFAGSFDPFVNPIPSKCRNCLEGNDVVIEGFVHITYSLMQRGLDILDIPAVESYLHENLKWIPRTTAGEYGRVEDLKSLEVTVIDTPLLGGQGLDIPVIGEVRKHNEVTFDMPGGRVRVPGRA
ncbi:hypothetical protein FRC01_000192 [Tulasnella sp. 417]|nr:hypothetical protein FRC01_000192 [Tulasnella sp. 417]